MKTVSAEWVVPVEGPPIENGAVAIADDGTIAEVGASADLGPGEHYDGCVIVPGFVNAHSHLEYATYAGFGDGLPFVPWIGMHVARKQALDPEDMVAIATIGALECLRSGITTIGDCSFSGAAAAAAAATGLRAIVYLEVFGRDVSALDRFHELHSAIAPLLSDLIAVGVSPHAPYTCTVEVYRACAELGLPLATHFAESPAEREWLVAGRGDWSPLASLLVPPPGETGIRLLAAAGLLGPGLTAAHCVHADPEEIELLAEHGVGVAHCPRSNGFLGCGIAPLEELRTAGVPVSIATDSPASTPSFDLFEELRCAIVGRPIPGRAAGRPPGGGGARARHARRRTRSRDGRPGGVADAGETGRPGRDLARRLAVRSRRGSRRGGRARRLARPRRSYSGGRRAALRERNVPMARFDKSSTKRPKQNAAVAASRGPKRSTAPSIEDTMFFPRLRRHAKWMFVFLAVALGGGFVLFGVGAGGTGVGDLFRGNGGSSGTPSISSAQKKTVQNPKDVQAWRDLSTALQTDGQTSKAIDAQYQVVVLTPKDADALRELAGLYLAQATEKQRQAQILYQQAQYSGAGGGNPGALVSGTGQPILEDKIGTTIAAQSAAAIQSLVSEAQSASSQAVARLPADRCLAAERPERPARARPGRRAGRGHGDRNCGVHAPSSSSPRTTRAHRSSSSS